MRMRQYLNKQIRKIYNNRRLYLFIINPKETSKIINEKKKCFSLRLRNWFLILLFKNRLLAKGMEWEANIERNERIFGMFQWKKIWNYSYWTSGKFQLRLCWLFFFPEAFRKIIHCWIYLNKKKILFVVVIANCVWI